MSQPHDEAQLTDEQIRRLEAELERVTVDDLLLQTIVSLVNLGARKGAVGAPPEVKGDPEQLHQAIEAVRALLPLLEKRHADKLAPIRDALSQLQLHYARSAPGTPPPAREEAPSAGPGPAQSSGRLWVPGQ